MPDNIHTEVELKLRLLNPEAAAGIFALPPLAALAVRQPQAERLEAWYYDTNEQLLQKAGIAYRVRFENNQWLATVKAGGTSAGGLHKRREWNIPVEGPLPDVEYLRNTEAGEILLENLNDNELQPLFCTAFDRHKVEFETAYGGIIELAVDLGAIIAGDKQEQIAELELELKSGQPEELLSLGAELAKHIPVMPEPRSKYFRGLCLAGLAASDHRHDSCGAIDLGTDAGNLAGRLLTCQIHRVFAAQAVFLQDITDPETLHQFRIQIRKLRSFLSFAKPLVESGEYARWQEDLRTWNHSTNALRELDVTIETWRDVIAASIVKLMPPPWLEMMLREERNRQSAAFASTVNAGQSTPLLLGLWANAAKPAFDTENSSLTGLEFSTKRLSLWLTDMRVLAKTLSPDDFAALHQLRILGKKLRYTLENLPLKDRKTRLMLARLKKLNDNLGVIRDCRTVADSLDIWLSEHASRILFRDIGILHGWTAKNSWDAKKDLERNLQRFKRVSRRWLRDREK